jgi:hypothetical protein
MELLVRPSMIVEVCEQAVDLLAREQNRGRLDLPSLLGLRPRRSIVHVAGFPSAPDLYWARVGSSSSSRAM